MSAMSCLNRPWLISDEGCRLQHELVSRSSGEAAPPPPHHARRLSRFGLEAVPRRSDSTSSVPPGHSRRSSVSEVSTGAYSEAESVGSLVRRSSDPDIQVSYPHLRRKPTPGCFCKTGKEGRSGICHTGNPSSPLKHKSWDLQNVNNLLRGLP